MCSRARCRACGKTTWSGCGRHVTQVLQGVPKDQRCTCATPDPEGGSWCCFFWPTWSTWDSRHGRGEGWLRACGQRAGLDRNRCARERPPLPVGDYRGRVATGRPER
ncbi:hypothetical protein DFJ74DRAFT_111951 [Hyaloraphidium curvatum]|nr:hypothetical protein DFJ74DRAFT_111951 [Hyaloraphidium curvatum]